MSPQSSKNFSEITFTIFTVMIDKIELLNNKEFYKSFKSGEDLASFFKQMQKSAVEHMLNAELDAHLDNEKHEKTKDGNYRKGHGTKKIKSPRCAKSPDFEPTYSS